MNKRSFRRYAVYHLPDGPLGAFGASWLGWDWSGSIARLNPVTDPWTTTARRYGFHATLKAPFRLAADHSPEMLVAAVSELAQSLAPVALPAFRSLWLGRFLALVPDPQPEAVRALAARCVADLKRFRAPLTEVERARYDGRRLSAAQRQNLDRWGYPHVMQDFRFHLTLTDRVEVSQRPLVETALAEAMPDLSLPYTLSHISLVGEDESGRFHQVVTCPLCALPVGSDR